MRPNPGYCPADVAGRRVHVELVNGCRPAASWAADGKGACRWSLTGSPFDIAQYEVAK